MSVICMNKLKDLIRQKGIGATLSKLEIYEYLGITSGFVGMLIQQLEKEGVLESLTYPVIYKGQRLDVPRTIDIRERIEEELKQTEVQRIAALAARTTKSGYRIVKLP